MKSELRSCPDGSGDMLIIWCAPCDTHHQVYVSGDATKHPVWGFNGNLEAPTITPSIKVSYEFGDDQRPTKICHSHVTDGQIAYCGDSTHALTGQTVPLEDLP